MVLDLTAELTSHTPLPSAMLQLDLSACKLLDTALSLPTDFLSHFQLVQWGFGSHDTPTSPSGSPGTSRPAPTGYTALAQLHRLFTTVPDTRRMSAARQEPPYLHMATITSLTELKPLFVALAAERGSNGATRGTTTASFQLEAMHSRLVAVESAVTEDFLD